MKSQELIDSLERFGRMLPEMVREVSPDDSRWKPPDGAWSILEIVRHLADEEQFDFRARLQATLTDPAAEWPSIDPETWAIERRYNEGELGPAILRFTTLRSELVAWLRSLVNPVWSQTHQHPRFGPIRAGNLLASWAAHDILHLRQISKRLYQMVARDAGDYSIRYAGD